MHGESNLRRHCVRSTASSAGEMSAAVLAVTTAAAPEGKALHIVSHGRPTNLCIKGLVDCLPQLGGGAEPGQAGRPVVGGCRGLPHLR